MFYSSWVNIIKVGDDDERNDAVGDNNDEEDDDDIVSSSSFSHSIILFLFLCVVRSAMSDILNLDICEREKKQNFNLIGMNHMFSKHIVWQDEKKDLKGRKNQESKWQCEKGNFRLDTFTFKSNQSHEWKRQFNLRRGLSGVPFPLFNY